MSCGIPSARSQILARYCRFFRGLVTSPSSEVACLANLLARDVRSSTGRNINTISNLTGKDPRLENPPAIKVALEEAELVEIQNLDKWRVRYLGVLLEQRMQLHYLGADDKKLELQHLIDSLCVN